jgi:hypothetical protein
MQLVQFSNHHPIQTLLKDCPRRCPGVIGGSISTVIEGNADIALKNWSPESIDRVTSHHRPL